jgi:hypothetical protein
VLEREYECRRGRGLRPSAERTHRDAADGHNLFSRVVRLVRGYGEEFVRLGVVSEEFPHPGRAAIAPEQCAAAREKENVVGAHSDQGFGIPSSHRLLCSLHELDAFARHQAEYDGGIRRRLLLWTTDESQVVRVVDADLV